MGLCYHIPICLSVSDSIRVHAQGMAMTHTTLTLPPLLSASAGAMACILGCHTAAAIVMEQAGVGMSSKGQSSRRNGNRVEDLHSVTGADWSSSLNAVAVSMRCPSTAMNPLVLRAWIGQEAPPLAVSAPLVGAVMLPCPPPSFCGPMNPGQM